MSQIEPLVGGATDPRVLLAAANNAAWCTSMCRAHDLETHQDRQRWWSTSRTPLYYPDVVTLDPATTGADVLQGIDTSVGCSVKDSFSTLDLTSAGFRLWFEATWIHLPAASRTAPRSGLRGAVVRDRTALRQWQRVWGDGGPDLFVPPLLEDPDVRLISVREHADVAAVAVLNRSAGAVGISNLVIARSRAVEIWAAVVAVAADLFPGLAIVGYEQQDELANAVAAGFAEIGPVRVWGC